MVAVNAESLKGLADVEFDFGVSSSVKAAFTAEAAKLTGQRGSRAAWRSTGLTDFKGHFSEVFRTNGTTQLSDLDEVASALKKVVTEIAKVEEAARAENARRKTAREWAQSQEDRSGLEKGWDKMFGEEDPPLTSIEESGPSASVAAPAKKARQTPAPGAGGGGGGGGTSSARPSKLRSFASSTISGDSELSGSASKLDGQCVDFASSCSWAVLDANGPIQGLRDWLTLNGEDGRWATTVADAFKTAGGEGAVSTLSNQSIEAALRSGNVSAGRQDIEVDPPTAYGSPPTTGYAADPVNTSTGNFIENECDLSFTGLASGLQFTRSYNSMNATRGAFGRGWASWAEVGLNFDDEGARLRLPDGRQIPFPREGAGWGRAVGENLWLATSPEGNEGFRVSSSVGMGWQFDRAGRLLWTDSGPGTRVSFEFAADGRLLSMGHEFGHGLVLEWDESAGLIRAVVGNDGRRADYVYDDKQRLVTVSSSGGARGYRWNDADLIEAVVDADGVFEVVNSYDEVGRVTLQRSPFGRDTRFVYLPGGITEVSDADGTRANTWISDARGRLIGVIDAEGNRQSTSYDRQGNPVLVTQRDGSAVLSSYDERGRRIRQVTPSGADVKWVYDDADRPVTVTVTNEDTESETRYVYDDDSRDPAEIVDPEGGLTRMCWERGLLQEIVDPVGVTVRFGYDDRGELVASTDADGNTARLERDALGRVTAAITPLGHRTSYRYDGNGPLVSRKDPNGGIWRYEHTAAGRMVAIMDPMGGRSEVEHGAHGEAERAIDPLGRAVTSSYDDLGNLNRVELPDGSQWEFSFDALSRLTTTTDAAGGRWSQSYDINGQLSATQDPTGVEQRIERDKAGRPVRLSDRVSQTSAEYDALGRTVAETGPDGSVSHSSYDRCGRLTAFSDPTGAVTTIERDLAGRAVYITHPEGSTFGYEYDACGRRSATIDTDGSRYGFVYDADGQLVRELWPTGETAELAYDDAGQLVERFEPGQGRSTYGYDAAGRLTSSVDAWNGRRRFRYDAAGQLIEAVNALGGVSRYEYDTSGLCVAVIDPLGGRTERSFDPMGQLLAETDPLGRTTRYGYDAAGRQTRQVDATGTVLSWTYDDTGRNVDTLANGELLSSVERDFTSRTMRVRDKDSVSELVWDANGRLIRRLRDGVGLSWSYDGDGRRRSFTGVHGEQTRYEYDQAGRVSAIDTPELGRAVIERDAIGRIASMSATGLYASWTWAGGAVTRLEVSREGQAQVTEIECDEAGRVLAETTDQIRTAYSYDSAGQLVEARRSDGSVSTYAYDAGGRLVQEAVDGVPTKYSYDKAGQLLTQRGASGVNEYRYDQAGQRVFENGPAGERRFSWDPRGFLESVTTITKANDKVTARTQRFQVDSLGELAGIDDEAVSWDSAAGTPTLSAIGNVTVAGFGPLTGLTSEDGGAGEWISPQSRSRSVGDDAWGVGGKDAPGMPSGVSVGAAGGLSVGGGLEWMEARVYDGGSRGFLSTDPLDPVTGSAWAGNPYSFAGNDPVNRSDPWGLSPVTEADLQAYRDSNNGSLRNAASAAKSWVGDNWEYIAAGAMIVGGVALMATGVGGPVGAAMIGGALMSAGASTGIQKHQNGSVDWGQVAVDGAIGGVAGAAGGGAGMAALRTAGKTGANGLARTAAAGMVGGAADGGVAGGLSYAASGQPLTAGGLAKATAGGATVGSLTGGATVAAGRLTSVARSACFTAGTEVLMADGSSKAIEDVSVGDEVMAADVATGDAIPKSVLETYVHEDVETWTVETSAGAVTSTAEHPFYVVGRGWVPVRELRNGDQLIDEANGVVAFVSAEATNATAAVYNFHVAKLNNYHVRAQQEVWLRVHNTCRADHAIPIGPVDEKTWSTLDRVTEKGSPFPNFKGGKPYGNNPESGAMKLPESDANGPISYREWDVDPNVNQRRTAQRLVTGSDSSAYGTRDHYESFVRIR